MKSEVSGKEVTSIDDRLKEALAVVEGKKGDVSIRRVALDHDINHMKLRR